MSRKSHDMQGVTRMRVCCAAAAIAIVMPVCSRAQDLTPGEIRVSIMDARTHGPLANADVFLVGGERPVSTLSDAKGESAFSQVSPGIYHVTIVHAGYEKYDTGDIEVAPHGRVTLAVSLAKDLKTIAVVQARSATVVTSEDINGDSAQRKISSTLSGALNKLAGVLVNDSPGGGLDVSLHNHDASETALSINGIRLSGQAGNMIGAGDNLFSGASIDFTPTADALGGSIDFQTLRPTKTWNYNAKAVVGNYGAQTFSLSATGTAGRFGFALQRASSATDAFVSGLDYEDQSGSRYLHVGGHGHDGNLVKVVYTANKRTSISLSDMSTTWRSDELCTNFYTDLPCGYGPGAVTGNKSSLVTFAVTSLIGNVNAIVNVYKPFGRYWYEYPQRALNGVPSPYYSRGTYDSAGGYAGASITAGRHTYSVGMQYSQYTGSVSRPVAGVGVTIDQPVEQQRSFELSNRVKANERLALSHSMSIASATGAGSTLVVSERADWALRQGDKLGGSLSIGSASPSYGTRFPITDALASDIDCHNGSMYVNGPPDRTLPQSNISYNLGWQHSFHRGSLQFNTYRQSAVGQSRLLAVPILAEPDDIFASGLADFLQKAKNVWSVNGVCGSTPFDPRHVYIAQMVSGLGQVYQGFDFSGRLNLGRNVALFPMYALNSTYLSSLDPRLQVPGSYYGVGWQLPHRPLRTAGLTFDGLLTHGKIEWLANAQFTAINNAQDLPAYTTYNAGLVLQADIGTLTLMESNIFGTHSGLFTTYQGIYPMPVVGGGTFAFATTPLPPRQWQFTWDIPWHQRVPKNGRT